MKLKIADSPIPTTTTSQHGWCNERVIFTRLMSFPAQLLIQRTQLSCVLLQYTCMQTKGHNFRQKKAEHFYIFSLAVSSQASCFQPWTSASCTVHMIYTRGGGRAHPRFPWEKGCEVNKIITEKYLSMACTYQLLSPEPIVRSVLLMYSLNSLG